MAAKKKSKLEKSKMKPEQPKNPKKKPSKDPKKSKPKPKKKPSKDKRVLDTDEAIKVYSISPNPAPAKNGPTEKAKKPWKTYAVIGLLGLTVLVLLITLIVVLVGGGKKGRNVCETPECINLAHQLHNWQDTSVDPCQDFFKYSCGKYNEHTVVEGAMMDKKNIISRALIKEFILKNESTSSKSERVMKLLYVKCQEFKNQTKWAMLDKVNLEKLQQDIEPLGSWPLLVGSGWDESAFDLNEILKNYAILTGKEIPEISFGLFKIVVPGPRPVLLQDDTELWTIDTATNFVLYFLQLFNPDLKIDDIGADMVEMMHFGQQIHQAIASIPEKEYENPIADFSQLKTYFKIIDFFKILKGLKTGQSDKIRQNIAVLKTFLDSGPAIEQVISSTPKKTIANYLIYRYFESAYKSIGLAKTEKCENIVIKYLPHASLRVFIQNHFDKENLEIVSDLVDDIKKKFIGTLQDSTWIHSLTREKAILKVEHMKKTVGYPEEFETAGAYDGIFDIEASPKNTFLIIMSKIQQFSIRQMLNFVSGELSINPNIMMLANAQYTSTENALTVFVPMMDEPLFDSSFPHYAQIAGAGYIIGHEVGHGFDTSGVQFDENGNVNLWIEKQDQNEYLRRANCFIDQYERYDDPSFGRKLNGTLTIDEMIADQLGANVAHRMFDDLDLSEEPRLIGFEDYSVEKLYFQIHAMNWCSPRMTHSLKAQMEDSHATFSFRINGVFANMESFGKTFDCPAGSPMNPDKKCELF